MPWSVERRDGRYCVVKDADGEVEGCHDSRVDAIKQQRALYANESRMASAEGPLSIPDLDLSPIVAAVAPLKPARAAFEREEADGPTPITITASGEVFGHLALWETCHSGFLNGRFSECVQAPRSGSGYSFFHLGQMETAEGDLVAVGKMTYDTSHAPITAGMQAATKHYDDTGSVGAFVRARDGRHGIWISGVLRSDLSPEGVRDMRANPPSGDWRVFRDGQLELIASLAVVSPGFPIPRAQLALAASARGDMEVSALILPGVTEMIVEEGNRDYLRRRHSLVREVL